MKDFRKYYLIKAQPSEVYLALTNPLTIHLWSGEEAEMSDEPGSEFSLWEGSITGRNLEFEKDRLIRQEWYFGEQHTPSIVSIKLHPNEAGTSVELRHINIPDEDYADIVDGWNTMYFGALQEFYEDE
jgi:uncharacterized protein YndB with AHSA1/START domain